MRLKSEASLVATGLPGAKLAAYTFLAALNLLIGSKASCRNLGNTELCKTTLFAKVERNQMHLGRRKKRPAPSGVTGPASEQRLAG